jgi:hypothetical protein
MAMTRIADYAAGTAGKLPSQRVKRVLRKYPNQNFGFYQISGIWKFRL